MRFRVSAGLTALMFAASAWLSVPVQAQRRGAPPSQEQTEGLALTQYVHDVVTGVSAPPDATLSWDSYFVKSQGESVYVPFTVKLDPDKLGRQVAMYYSVVPQGPQLVGFKAAAQDGDENAAALSGELVNTSASVRENVKLTITMLDASGKPLGTEQATVPSVAPGQRTPFTATVKVPRNTTQYSVVVEGADSVFRDLSFLELPTPSRGQPVRVSRAFVAPPGSYDVYVVLRERPRDPRTPPKVALLKERVVVPNLSSELMVSSIFLADKIEPLSAPLKAEDQIKQPYTLGTMAIEPATSNAIRQSGELSIIFFVYNTGVDPGQKPNVQIQYNFHRKTAEGEKFFNRTNPQDFNAQTLPPEFSLSQGHQIVGGQSVPLASFEPGDYRLEIQVSDKVAGKTVTANVPFTVVG